VILASAAAFASAEGSSAAPTGNTATTHAANITAAIHLNAIRFVCMVWRKQAGRREPGQTSCPSTIDLMLSV
jgi:hypothetical protein